MSPPLSPILPWWYHWLALLGAATAVLGAYHALDWAAGAAPRAWQAYRRRRRLARTGYSDRRPDRETHQLWRQTRVPVAARPRAETPRIHRLGTLSPGAQAEIRRHLDAATRQEATR